MPAQVSSSSSDAGSKLRGPSQNNPRVSSNGTFEETTSHNRMKSMTENVVECVNAILKTLECSICLELLKTPVSTGCGHYFCRFCITETLQSNYRMPCPLCKKSFTRRGIQDAYQRRSILVAAKKLADVCETFADVKFFNKECSRSEVEDKIMPTLTFLENQSNATEKATRTSVGRKRKSNEKEKDAALKETNDPSPVLEKIGTNTTDVEPLKDAQGDSSDDEAIPTSNKRCRQSVEDSDSDGLPDIKTLFQYSSVPNVSDEHSSDAKNLPVLPILVAPKTLYFETNKNLYSKQDINSVSKNISSATKTNIKDSISISPKKNKSDIQNVNESSKQQIKTCESNCLKIVRKRRFNSQNLKEKNKSNPLRNKTNELNIDDTTNNNINIALNVIEEVDKNINSLALEKTDEAEGNKEMIKENYQTKDGDLFSSPLRAVCNKSDLKNVSPKKRTKTPKSGRKNYPASSSEEEERLIAKLNDAEKFELTISKNTIPSTVLVNNSKECYNLNEINIPELKETEKTIDDDKKASQSDDIADTAISVQTVASPETSKAELVSRSPGWSKVKQVGKDFRIKKFSKLSVEKNSSHSCPTEMTSAEQTKQNTSPSESLGTPRFKKLPYCDITKDIHSEEFSRNSEATKISKNSSLENEVTGDKQSINCHEQMSDGEKRIEKTAVTSELGKYDHNSLAKKNSQMDCQTEINLHSAVNENRVALEESREVNKNRKDNITTVLSNDCSLLERHNLTSTIPVNNHILPDFQLFSISDSRNGTFKSIQNNIFNTGIDYEGEDICMNGEENMEVDNFSANEHLKQPENEASCIDVLEKKIPIQTLSDADLCNEVNNPYQINVNSNFQHQYNEFEPCYVDSVLPSEKSFLKPDLKILPSATMIKENKLLSKISKISKCEITATKSIFDKDENVYYTEHSQQTSQRLLEFCNDGQRKQNSFTGSVAALDVPFYYAPNTQGIVAKRNSWYNQVEKFNPVKFGLGPQNTEKTKVLKRTCLTLDEIQEAFASSNMSGTAETICSLPFSNDFRLRVCVSEETLNISVLKVVDSEFDSPNIIQVRKTVAEKNIQTSNNNSPVEILPSSNVASDSSQPDQGSSKMKNNIFPYLSKYFPDSESADQPCSDVRQSLLDNSEIIPFQGSKQSLNKNEDGNRFHLEEEAENDFHKNDISLHMGNNAFSLEAVNKDENNKTETNEGNEEMCVAMEGKTDTDIPILNDSSESLPPTLPYLGSKQNSIEGKKNDTHLTEDIIEPIGEVPEKNVLSSVKIVELTDSKLDEKLEKPNRFDKTNQFSKPEQNELSDDEENINFDELISYQKTSITSPNNIEINYSDGLSSDPAMAFAAQLIAPLKNIAAKMNSAGNNNIKKQAKGKISEVLNSREKRPLQEFEELVFNLSKNSANDTSINKSSRLSLKSKRTAKKFKRIKRIDSDDDSDSAHSSKDELCAAKDSLPEDKMEDVQVASSKVKELTCESLQEQSTLNSFLSEDITSKDPNQLAKEVEVLDKEIYSVVEQLKQCAKAQKVDLLSLAAEVGLDASPNLGSFELIKLIQSSADYEQETFKDILKAVTSARIQKEGKEREENEFLLKKMELEMEVKKIESTTGERVKSSLDVHHPIQKFNPEVGDISLYLTLIERQVKRAKVPEELWVSHLIGLLPSNMAQLIARELEEVIEDYEQVKQILLKQYKFSAEMFRQMFTKHSKNAHGTWKDFVERTKNIFPRMD
ncbi:hypothetical protein AVEN_149868-1 [Araneus ventricosus]|uniref:RING-type domain-containing protein n=1 Tax=Araneus ventricosus TaxID=182803 RepID=A0A4Y2DWJ6_ARAVE|nr:hypothetical protein AVEN_149868-1 [Araneus ventricosus]